MRPLAGWWRRAHAPWLRGVLALAGALGDDALALPGPRVYTQRFSLVATRTTLLRELAPAAVGLAR